MRLKPVNPNTSHPNRHTLFLGGTGTGKSQALRQCPEIPAKGARVILWDNNGDHAGLHTENKKQFIRLLKTGISQHASTGKGFRVAYAGYDHDDFEWFCNVVWAVLDGDHLTYVIGEELSQVCKHPGKASPNAARLLNQGRKFGLVFHGVSQKPQEISKTFFDQCDRKYIGCFRGDNAAKMARYLGKGLIGEVKTLDKILSLKPLEFIYDDGQAASEPELIKLNYKKVTGVKWV